LQELVDLRPSHALAGIGYSVFLRCPPGCHGGPFRWLQEKVTPAHQGLIAGNLCVDEPGHFHRHAGSSGCTGIDRTHPQAPAFEQDGVRNRVDPATAAGQSVVEGLVEAGQVNRLTLAQAADAIFQKLQVMGSRQAPSGQVRVAGGGKHLSLPGGTIEVVQ